MEAGPALPLSPEENPLSPQNWHGFGRKAISTSSVLSGSVDLSQPAQPCSPCWIATGTCLHILQQGCSFASLFLRGRMHKETVIVIMTGHNFFPLLIQLWVELSFSHRNVLVQQHSCPAGAHLTPSFHCFLGTNLQSRVRQLLNRPNELNEIAPREGMWLYTWTDIQVPSSATLHGYGDPQISVCTGWRQCHWMLLPEELSGYCRYFISGSPAIP